MKEDILVVRRRLFDRVGSFQGIRLNASEYLGAMWGSPNVFFAPRDPAEKDLSLKQIIPYVIVMHNGRILRYRRDKEGERRLEGFFSIGVGGHINTSDGDVHNCYRNGLAREMAEEIGLPKEIELPRVSAIINDDGSEVGAVHLGFVHVLRLNDMPTISKDLSSPEWVLPAELLKDGIQSFEPWSRICVKELKLLLCQWAQLEVGSGQLTPIEILREEPLPGMYHCRSIDGKRLTIPYNALR